MRCFPSSLTATSRPGVALLATFFWMFCAWSYASAADWSSYVYVHSGPDGEVQISTPWGDYAAYDEGNGYYWVGSQREFDRQRVIGIERESGFRLSTVNSAGADASFVSEGTLRAHVGGIDVDGLSPSITFGARIIDEHNRPVTNMRTVDFSWIQAEGTTAALLIVYSPHDHLRYLGHSEAAGQGWYHETLDVYTKDLLRAVTLVLVVSHARPAVIGIHSIAAVDYDVATRSVASDASLDVAESSDQAHHIQYLRMLDPSLVSGAHSAPTRTAQTTPAPTPTPQASSTPMEVAAAVTSSYIGSIADQMAGRGRISMTLLRDGNGSIIGGTWIASFSNPRFNNYGPIGGTGSETQDQAAFVLKSSLGGCPYEAHATTAADGSLEGTYSATDCSWRNGGSFLLHPTTFVTRSEQRPVSAPSPSLRVATGSTPEPIEPAAGATVPPAKSVAIVGWTPGHRSLRTPTGVIVDLRIAETDGRKTIYLRGMPIRARHGLLISFPNVGAYYLFNGAGAPMSVDLVTVSAGGEVENVLPLPAMEGEGVSEVGTPTGAQAGNQAKFVIVVPGGEAISDGLVPGATIDGLHS
jgi:hypothetical protein